MIEFTHQFIRY